MADYKVQLRQQHMVTIEEFTFNADNEEDALKQAKKFITDEKEYEKGSYILTAQQVPQPEEETEEAVNEPVQPETTE